jgi:hypothetical protein
MASSTDDLTEWIQGLKSLRLACIQLNPGTSHLSLNAFAGSIISSQLATPASVANFSQILNSQFAKTGPPGWSLQIAVNPALTFAELNALIGGSFTLLVERFVQSFCDASCSVGGILDLTKTVQDAFPAGAGDPNWVKLEKAIASTGLDQVITKTSVAQALAMIQTPAANTLSDLVKALTTI